MPNIAAIATPPGQGGISIARISGPGAKALLSRVFRPRSPLFGGFQPWRLHHGLVLDCEGEPLDDVLAVFMPGPRTFTGEDVAEIHCHGGQFIVRQVLETLLRLGARQAGRGEFTRRAFLNGRMDLSQAEAVAELIAAPSREALRYGLNSLDGLLGRKARHLASMLDECRALANIGIDFPDDEVPGLETEAFAARIGAIRTELESLLRGRRRSKMMREGALVAITGKVNAGKSSLLNALAGSERALVTDIPGTTRDFLEARLDLDGLPVCLLDTAGLRNESESADPVEKLGMARSRELLEEADAVICVVDGAALGEAGCAAPGPDAATAEIFSLAGEKPLLVVWNKCDLCAPAAFPPAWAPNACMVSAFSGENLDILTERLRGLLLAETHMPAPENCLAPNERQALALERARDELEKLSLDLSLGTSYDCCVGRLDCASAALEELLGLAGQDELLDQIFAKFCIGK